MKKLNVDTLIVVICIGLSVFVGFAIGVVEIGKVMAYDTPEVVDRAYETARSPEQQNYRFGPIKDDIQEYSDGSVVPSRTFSIEMYNETANRWEVIGYANTHLHKVKVDSTDQFDISVGSTHRINPKH